MILVLCRKLHAGLFLGKSTNLLQPQLLFSAQICITGGAYSLKEKLDGQMLPMAVLKGSISKGRDGEKDGRRGQRLEKGRRELPLHVVRYFLFLLNEYVMLCSDS